MEKENEVVVVTNVYGDVCIRKERRKRQKVLVRELMYDYANNTTLHGLPYMTKQGLTHIEKIFWFMTFIASVALCLFFIRELWFKWKTSPVIVTVSEQLISVNEVPFPSVTICPQSKCKASVYNFTYEKVTLDTFILQNKDSKFNETMRKRLAKYDGISQICNLPHFNSLTSIYPSGFTDASIVKDILEVSPNYTDVFGRCQLYGADVNCSTLFDTVLTGEGLCFNMNSLAATEIFKQKTLHADYQYLNTTKPTKRWSVAHGYESNDMIYADPEVYPVRGAENGEHPDVEVILQHKPDERDHLCNGLNAGFKVYINHPTDLPHSSLYYYAVLNNQVSSMALSFSVLNTSETLRNYDPEIRQCYFPDERYLKYFKLYTADNCRMECLSNITEKKCKCVQFHMPCSNSARICTELNRKCLTKARIELLQQESSKEGGFKCHCLPACNSIDYEAEILKTDYNLKRFIKTFYEAINVTDETFNGFNFSKLEMYFKRPRFLSMRRSELFGLIDFLANCGGLLGLFLGFSFLSLVEIFYFLSLRLCCTLKKDLKEEKKARQEPGKEIHIDKF